MLTADDIGKAAGLVPFDDFCAQHSAGPDEPRRTGRTTRALCEAIAAAANGASVVFVTHSDVHATMCHKQAVELARSAGIAYEAKRQAARFGRGSVRFLSRALYEKRRGQPDDVTVLD